MDDLNDIRLSLGTLHNRVAQLGERVDDILAAMATLGRLAQLVEDLDALVEAAPAVLDRAADDPMIGTMLGPQLRETASMLRTAVANRRQARVSAPSIESTG